MINCIEFFEDFTLIDFVNNFDYVLGVTIFNFIQLIVLVDYNFVFDLFTISILNFVDDAVTVIEVEVERFVNLLVNFLILFEIPLNYCYYCCYC